MNRCVRNTLALLVTLIASASTGVEDAVAQERFPGEKDVDRWNHVVVPYLWAVNLKGTNTVGTIEVPLDVSFGDLWADLKFAASVHYEAARAGWGFLIDFSYVSVGEEDIQVMEGPGGGTLTAGYEFNITAIEAAGMWRPLYEGNGRFSVLFGGRYNRQDMELALDAPAPLPEGGGFDESWLDPFVGGQWAVRWGRYGRWGFGIRADGGGFGLGSKFTFNSQTGVEYRFSKLFSLELAGRYMYVNYESGTEGTDDFFRYKADQSGLVLGAGFRF
jgi:hypothetical protein